MADIKFGGAPGRISVDGSTLEVRVAQEEALSLVGRDVLLQDGVLFAKDVLVAAQHAAGSVPVAPQGSAAPRDGRVTLTAGDSAGPAIFSSGPRGGTIRIEGGAITLDRANLFDVNPGELDSAGGIAVGAQSLTVVGQNAGLSTAGSGVGRAGSITVTAADVRVAGGTISSGLVGPAAAGDVTIHGDRVVLENGATVSAPVVSETGPDVIGGTITISAAELLTLRGGSRIFSDTFGPSDGGAVVIEAGRLEVLTTTPSALASAVSASTFGGGDAGSLSIEAGEILVDNSFISAGVGSGATGTGGVIDLTADHVILRNTGFIEASTLGAGDGGRVAIRAEEGIDIATGGIISAVTAETGRGGMIAHSSDGDRPFQANATTCSS
jgi:hypothetical protein